MELISKEFICGVGTSQISLAMLKSIVREPLQKLTELSAACLDSVSSACGTTRVVSRLLAEPHDEIVIHQGARMEQPSAETPILFLLNWIFLAQE